MTMPTLMHAVGNPAADEDQPTISKDSIVIKAGLSSGEEKNTRPWAPEIAYRVNGPLASGSQLSVEYSVAGKNPWGTIDCPTQETKQGYWRATSCSALYATVGRETGKGVFYTGLVGVTIRLRNELQGTNLTLFTGKMKVVKAPECPTCSGFRHFVDEDWRIPIGYVYFGNDSNRAATHDLHVRFWYRGNPPDIEAHLFYQGKEIAKYMSPGNGAADWTPKIYQWGLADCVFDGVYLTIPTEGSVREPRFAMSSNPGNYEVKVLIVNHLARSIKFTVSPDGKLDNGIASSNKLGSDRVIVPVQVIGTQEPFDRTAWKTGAFYGNPLTGFTGP